MRDFLVFVKSPVGLGFLLFLGLGLIAWIVANERQRNENAERARTAKTVVGAETIKAAAGDTLDSLQIDRVKYNFDTGEARIEIPPARKKPVLVTSRPKLLAPKQVVQPKPAPQPVKLAIQAQPAPPRVLFDMNLHTQIQPKPKQLSNKFLPYGEAIRCSTVMAIDNVGIDTPIIGLVERNVFSPSGNLVIPAGAEIHGTAVINSTRERVASAGSWVIVYADGSEMVLRGIALDRKEISLEHETWELTDGQGGISGEVHKRATMQEAKAFAAIFLEGLARGVQTRQTSVFGTTTTDSTFQNAATEGAAEVLDEYARRILREIERNSFYLIVPPGKPFYVYLTGPVDFKNKTRGGTRLGNSAGR